MIRIGGEVFGKRGGSCSTTEESGGKAYFGLECCVGGSDRYI